MHVRRPAFGSTNGGYLSAWDATAPPRFKSRQRFSLAVAGRRAEAAYRSLIVASRKQPGRPAFDAARSAWAGSVNLHPDDGIYLGELVSRPASLAELTDALLVCGKSRADALSALSRLVDAGFVCTTPED